MFRGEPQGGGGDGQRFMSGVVPQPSLKGTVAVVGLDLGVVTLSTPCIIIPTLLT
jgi:hypothetical protein